MVTLEYAPADDHDAYVYNTGSRPSRDRIPAISVIPTSQIKIYLQRSAEDSRRTSTTCLPSEEQSEKTSIGIMFCPPSRHTDVLHFSEEDWEELMLCDEESERKISGRLLLEQSHSLNS